MVCFHIPDIWSYSLVTVFNPHKAALHWYIQRFIHRCVVHQHLGTVPLNSRAGKWPKDWVGNFLAECIAGSAKLLLFWKTICLCTGGNSFWLLQLESGAKWPNEFQGWLMLLYVCSLANGTFWLEDLSNDATWMSSSITDDHHVCLTAFWGSPQVYCCDFCLENHNGLQEWAWRSKVFIFFFHFNN